MAEQTLPPLPQGATTTPPLPSGSLNFESLDKKTGAPKKIRATVSAYKKPEDKLNLIKKYYPDAIPFGSDNYVFTNPKTKRPTLFNPGGFDVGDVFEYGRIGAELIGAGFGGVAGGVATTPTVAGIPLGVAGGAATGSVVAGETYDAALRYFFGEGAEDERTLGEYAGDVALQGTIEALSPFPIAKGTEVLRKAAKEVFTDPSAKAMYQSAKNLDLKDLPLGVVTGPKVARAEGGLAQTVGGSAVVKSYAESLDQLNTAISNLTDTGRELSEEKAGDIILDASLKFEDAWKTQTSDLYNSLTDQMPFNKRFNLPNTKKVMNKNLTRFTEPGLSQLFGPTMSSKLVNIFPDPAKPQLRYVDIANLRTEIGKRLKGTFVVGTSPDLGEMKSLYGALTDDMYNSAKQMGGDVFATAKLANDIYKQGKEIIDKQILPITTQAKKDFIPSEKIYTKFQTNLKTEPSRTNQFLGNVFNKSLGNEDQLKLLGEKQFYELTRDAAGDFSPSKTITSLNKLKSKTGELPATIQQLGSKIDDVEKLSQGFKNANKFVNFSNTGYANAVREFTTALGFGGAGGLLTGDIATGAGLALTHYLTARTLSTALTNPVTKASFKNWAVRGDLPLDAKVSILTAIGLSGPQAQSLIAEQYKG
jgi:hypothetical protein